MAQLQDKHEDTWLIENQKHTNKEMLDKSRLTKRYGTKTRFNWVFGGPWVCSFTQIQMKTFTQPRCTQELFTLATRCLNY